MKYPNENKAIGISATPAERQAALCEALELGGIDEVHPNAREVLVRKVLARLDDDALTALLMTIDEAKRAYADRVAR